MMMMMMMMMTNIFHSFWYRHPDVLVNRHRFYHHNLNNMHSLNLLHVSASASAYFFPVYVIAILPDEGSNKLPKHLAEDKQISNTFHAWCQINIKSHLPVLNTSRFKIEYVTQSFVSLQLSPRCAVLGIRGPYIK